jgi:hypothetical protein
MTLLVEQPKNKRKTCLSMYLMCCAIETTTVDAHLR